MRRSTRTKQTTTAPSGFKAKAKAAAPPAGKQTTTTLTTASSSPAPVFRFKRPAQDEEAAAAPHLLPPPASPTAAAGVPPASPASSTGSAATRKPRARAPSKKAQQLQAENDDGSLVTTDLGDAGDVDYFPSLLSTAEDGEGDDDLELDDTQAYARDLRQLVESFGAGPVPHFAAFSQTQHPLLLAGQRVEDWKASALTRTLQCLADAINMHPLGFLTNYAVVLPVGATGIEEVGKESIDSMDPASSLYFITLGSGNTGVHLDLTLGGGASPLRLHLRPGSLVRVGLASATAITRRSFSLVKGGEEEEETVMVVGLRALTRFVDATTGKPVTDVGGARNRAAPAKKKDAGGEAAPKRKRAPAGSKKKEEEEEEEEEGEGAEVTATTAATAAPKRKRASAAKKEKKEEEVVVEEPAKEKEEEEAPVPAAEMSESEAEGGGLGLSSTKNVPAKKGKGGRWGGKKKK